MRIDEIDNIDKSWAILNGINLDIDTLFQDAQNILLLLIKLKSPYRNRILLPSVEKVEENLKNIINATLAHDSSTRLLKQKARKMLNEIQNLKNQL